MIKLRSLLEQSTESTSTEAKIPYVLFLGDAYTKSKSSYANVLIRSKLVEGRVIAWPNINLKQMNRLLKRYNNRKYSIVSMLFGDDIIKKINAESINTELNQLFNTAAQFGAKVVVVQNSVKQFPEQSSLLNDAIENESDLIISNVSALNIPNTHAKIAKRWLRDVDTTFKLNLKSNDAQIDAAADGTESSGNDIESDIVDSNDVIQPSNDTPVTGNFSDSVANQAYDMIIPHEGFNPQPEIDLYFDDEGKKHGDGYCRIGYGSSHITRADGTVIDLGKPEAGKTCAQTYPYTIKIEDAQRDLRRLIKDTFIPMVKRYVKQWGGDISKLNDATIATLVSVTYNYGHMPTELKPSIAASDPEAIGNALLTQFVKSTSNPKRRKKEGQYILNSLKSQPGLFKQALDAVKDVLGLNNTEPIVPKPYTGKLGYTSGFGPRWGKFHYGVDFSLGVGTPIYIVIPGEITRADGRNATGYGNVIYVKHDDGVVTRYGHMSRMDVAVGQRVEKGDLIGLTGGKKGAPGAGNSTGPHLHWEYHVNGKAVDGINEAEKYFSTKPVKIEQQPIELPSLNV